MTGPGRGPVLVTGASGNVGGATMRALLELGVPVRAAGTASKSPHRRQRYLGQVAPARGEDALGGGGGEPSPPEWAELDFFRPETFAAAVDGISGLFLLRPPPVSRVGPTLNALTDAALAAGVEHIVFSSVAGADTNRVVPHHRVETHLRDHAPSWTILRPGFFSQNLADAYRQDIVRDDRILLPAGAGRVAFVDTRDVGAVAARVFADPQGHRGQGYTLTGSRAVDFDEVATILTAELGRPIRYEPSSIVRYARHLRAQGLPMAQVAVQAVLHTGLRRGQAQNVDPTLERLLGRPARTLEGYVHDERRVWQRHPAS